MTKTLWIAVFAARLGSIQGIGTENGATKCLTGTGDGSPGALVVLSDCTDPVGRLWFIGDGVLRQRVTLWG